MTASCILSDKHLSEFIRTVDNFVDKKSGLNSKKWLW